MVDREKRQQIGAKAPSNETFEAERQMRDDNNNNALPIA